MATEDSTKAATIDKHGACSDEIRDLTSARGSSF
jgi:hypothetical protein